MSIELLMMLSEIIDRMEIKDELKSLEINTGDEVKDNEALGKELIVLLITRMYKCKDRIYSFVASYKGYLPDKEDFVTEEEYETEYKKAIKTAKKEDVIAIFKEILKLDGIKDFLS